MIIIINKETKEVINNMGTNSAFPDGNIPNINCKKNQQIIRLHDNSKLAQKIINTENKYIFKDDLTDIITLEDSQEETERKEKDKKTKELQMLDKQVSPLLERLLKVVTSHPDFKNFKLTEDEERILNRKEQLRRELMYERGVSSVETKNRRKHSKDTSTGDTAEGATEKHDGNKVDNKRRV